MIEEILPEPSFKKAKTKTLPISDRYMKFNPKKANQILDCGQTLWFYLKEHKITLEQKLKLAEMYTCKDRFCPFCNWRRELKYKKLIYSFLDTLHAQKSIRYIFLTLTVPNCHIDDLKATIQHMNKSFERLSKTKAYKKAVLGHFKALEILGDNTKGAEAHPHFHILLIVDKNYFTSKNYISQKEFLQMWRDATRNQNITQVNIKKIKPKKNSNLTALQSAVFEVAKYSVKHTDLVKKSDYVFTKILNQTRNMRFFSTGGILKEMINLLKCDEDLIQFNKDVEALWIEIEEEIYRWQNGDFYLEKINVIQEKE